MNTHTSKFVAALFFTLVFASSALAYPSVVVSTPYNDAPEVQTTVLYNPYSGNVYVHENQNANKWYTDGYYDGKYRRNPNFCQYDWFDRCKFDPDRAYDYYYSRCAKYDPADDEWYDRGCDYYFGRYRPGSYGGSFDHYYADYPENRYYSNYHYGNYYTASYPRLSVHYLNDYTYENRGYWSW